MVHNMYLSQHDAQQNPIPNELLRLRAVIMDKARPENGAGYVNEYKVYAAP